MRFSRNIPPFSLLAPWLWEGLMCTARHRGQWLWRLIQAGQPYTWTWPRVQSQGSLFLQQVAQCPSRDFSNWSWGIHLPFHVVRFWECKFSLWGKKCNILRQADKREGEGERKTEGGREKNGRKENWVRMLMTCHCWWQVRASHDHSETTRTHGDTHRDTHRGG